MLYDIQHENTFPKAKPQVTEIEKW